MFQAFWNIVRPLSKCCNITCVNVLPLFGIEGINLHTIQFWGSYPKSCARLPRIVQRIPEVFSSKVLQTKVSNQMKSELLKLNKGRATCCKWSARVHPIADCKLLFNQLNFPAHDSQYSHVFWCPWLKVLLEVLTPRMDWFHVTFHLKKVTFFIRM